jgi:uncharacterized protein YjbI with pentapeptide repeats
MAEYGGSGRGKPEERRIGDLVVSSDGGLLSVRSMTDRPNQEQVAQAKGWAERGRTESMAGADLHGGDFTKIDWAGADLHQANLTRSRLSVANLEKANLQRAVLDGADLVRANLQMADLSGATGPQARFDRADLRLANLRGASFQNAFFNEAILENAQLQRANLSGASLRGTKLAGVDLSEANLSGADLAGADLSGAILFKVNMTGVRNANIVSSGSYPSSWPVPPEEQQRAPVAPSPQPPLKGSQEDDLHLK